MYERTYHEKVLKKEEVPAPPRRRWKRWLFLVLLLGGTYGIGILLRHPRFQIVTVGVVGTEVLAEEDVSASVQNILEGRYLWLFPKTSTFLIQTHTLERLLQEQYPRANTIRITRDGIRGLIVTITEYQEAYLWCTHSDECFFMDATGVVYSHAPVFSGSAYERIYAGTPAAQLPFTGVSPSQVSFIRTLSTGMKDIGIAPTAIRFISPREVRIDFLHNKKTAQFIVDPTVPAMTSLEYLYSGIRTDPLSGVFGDETKQVSYIDVRYPNNIVYKILPVESEGEQE